MNYTKTFVINKEITDNDIFSTLYAVVNLIRKQEQIKAQQEHKQKDYAYDVLLKMYLSTIKTMNVYKQKLIELNNTKPNCV